MNADVKQTAATVKPTGQSDAKQTASAGLVGTGEERWHGTENGYAYHKCRCEACKEAHRLTARKYDRKEYDPENTPERVHGTVNGYSNYKCRCDACRAAWATWIQEKKDERAARPIPEHVHGTQNGYGNYKCRCEACTTAWSKATVDRARRRQERAKQSA